MHSDVDKAINIYIYKEGIKNAQKTNIGSVKIFLISLDFIYSIQFGTNKVLKTNY